MIESRRCSRSCSRNHWMKSPPRASTSPAGTACCCSAAARRYLRGGLRPAPLDARLFTAFTLGLVAVVAGGTQGRRLHLRGSDIFAKERLVGGEAEAREANRRAEAVHG